MRGLPSTMGEGELGDDVQEFGGIQRWLEGRAEVQRLRRRRVFLRLVLGLGRP